MLFSDTWNAFTKWCKSQLDLDRTISIAGFGNISYKINEDSKDQKDKTLMIYISEQLIQQSHLKYRGEVDNSHYPPIKINFAAV